jgi:cellulose synthase/poly-beta-1,6-N-acetylglucosamine synthase-like glycosyltransferase
MVIDDHSTDATAELVRQFRQPNLRLLQLEGPAAGKKAALTYGIQEAGGALILTTDADCTLPIRWVASFVSYYEQFDPVFITGPVVLSAGPSALERFQALDMLGTMLITGAGIRSRTIHMSNGANLAYPKAIFESVGGFSGIDHLASGDDMLLMHKIQQVYPGRLAFLKCPTAVVSTPAVKGWRAFIQQRLRWATKSGTYQDRRIIVVLALVFLLCWSILLSPFLILFFGWQALWISSILILMKTAADLRLLGRAGRYFRRAELMRSFPASQLFHILYIAGIGLMANLVGQYHWKGRRQR